MINKLQLTRLCRKARGGISANTSGEGRVNFPVYGGVVDKECVFDRYVVRVKFKVRRAPGGALLRKKRLRKKQAAFEAEVAALMMRKIEGSI